MYSKFHLSSTTICPQTEKTTFTGELNFISLCVTEANPSVDTESEEEDDLVEKELPSTS